MESIIKSLAAAGFTRYPHGMFALQHPNGVRLFFKKSYATVSGVAEGECAGLVVEDGKRDTAFCRHRLPYNAAAAEAFANAILEGKVVVNKARASRATGGLTVTDLEGMLQAASK